MDQQGRKLFYDGYREALRDDCKAIDDTAAWAKNVGKLLFPEIVDPIEAGRRLNDKTNPNRDDRLSDDQERLIMRLSVRKRGFSAAHDYISDEIEMERAKPKDRKDEMLELQGRVERGISELKSLMERQERLIRMPLASVPTKTG